VPIPTSSAPNVPVAARLAAAVDRTPFVLLVAPAGSGKTTTLAAWSVAETRRTPVWLRLDAQDDDVHTLSLAIGAAIRQVARGPTRSEQLSRSPTAFEVSQVVAALALDLDALGDAVLVLDDLHHLRSGDVLDLISALLAEAGPAIRVIAASRVEPALALAHRRVRREVLEFTAADLRLDRGQIGDLLADVGVHDELMAEQILHRSKGWAAAAVLMAARVGAEVEAGRAPSAAQRAATLASSESDIELFLRTELLNELDEELRRFVLRTSLLDELDVASCTQLAATTNAEALLELARRRGLVERVAPADDASGASTLRYYEWIAAFLRKELRASTSAAESSELFRSAAQLSSPMTAIALLLDAGDSVAAATRVATVGRTLLETPGGRVPRSWLARFDAEQIAGDPWLALIVGLAAIEDGDIGSAAQHLTPVVATMRERGDRAGLLRSAYGLAEAHLVWGQVIEAAALIDELLELDTTADERVKVLMAKLWLDYFGGDWEAVGASLDKVFRLAFSSCTELGRSTVALGLGTEFLFGPRGPQWLLDRCVELGRRIQRDAMAAAALEVMQAAAYLIVGDVRRTEELVAGVDERALEMGSLNWLAMAADRVSLGLALTTGDHHRVEAIVDAARMVLATSDRHYQERAMYAYALARSGWLRGQPTLMRAAQVLLGEVTVEDRPDTAATAAVIAAMVQRHDGDCGAAEATLRSARDCAEPTRFCLLTGLLDLELAGVLLGAGRPAEAIAAARPALRTLADLDAVGLLVMDGSETHRAVLAAAAGEATLESFAQRALDRLATPVATGTVTVAETQERLSVRELDVLRLVVAGASNRSIADQLFIGERTVKSHMTSLMRKLGVTSRTAAIARARQLRIS
jgi:LuxR family transcriptional regulator, maltose regulon positive regulatory protein